MHLTNLALQCNRNNCNVIKTVQKQRVMWWWNKSIMQLLSLLTFCRLIETTGLCEFKTMFPNEGKAEYCNGKTFAQGKARRQESTLPPCPPKMIHGNCTCLATCEDTTGSIGCYNTCMGEVSCVCPDGFLMKNDLCVPQNECDCYSLEAEKVIPNMESCTLATDCYDLFNAGFKESGIYIIKPNTWSGSAFEVSCNMDDGGGWTVFQRRVNGSVDFYRDWEDYKQGFGILNHEFWLGNDKIHSLTYQRNYTLRIDLVNSLGSPFYAFYDLFKISGENDMYNLKNADIFSGTAVPDGMKRHKGYNFSTRDRDNDNANIKHCAIEQHGAWWYRSCGRSNLNGGYFGSRYASIRWNDLPGNEYNIKFTEMKIRP